MMRRQGTLYRRGVSTVVGAIIALAAMIALAIIITQALDERMQLAEERLERAREDLKITPLVNSTGVYAEVLNRGYVDTIIRHIIVVNRSSGQVIYHATPQLPLSPGNATIIRLGSWSSGRLDIAVITHRGSVFRWDPELTIDGVLDLPGEPLAGAPGGIVGALQAHPELRGCILVNTTWVSAAGAAGGQAFASAGYWGGLGGLWVWVFAVQAGPYGTTADWDNVYNNVYPLPIMASSINPPVGLYAAIYYDGGLKLQAEAAAVANITVPPGYRVVVLGSSFTPIPPDMVLYGTPAYILEPPWGLAPLNTSTDEISIPMDVTGEAAVVEYSVQAQPPPGGEALALVYRCP